MKKMTVLVVVFLMAMGLVFAQQMPVAAQTTAHLVQVGNKICPVSGDPVAGSKMGSKGVNFEYNGKVYHLCCKMCIKDFKKNPKKYSKIAEDEVKAEKK